MFTLTPTVYRPMSLASMFWDSAMSETKHTRYATDVIDDGERYRIMIDLPGFQKEEISVSLQTKYLTISAKHAPLQEKDGEVEVHYLRRERFSEEFSRTYTVQNIEEDGIGASYENGVLTVTLQKKKPIEPETRTYTVR